MDLQLLTMVGVLAWAASGLAQDLNLPAPNNSTIFDDNPGDGSALSDGGRNRDEKNADRPGAKANLTSDERISLAKLMRLGATCRDIVDSKRRFAVGEIDLREAISVEACLEELIHLEGLECVTLEGRPVTDKEIGHMPLHLVLCDLNVNSTLITDDGLKMICRIRSLQGLGLANTEITGEGLAYLSRLPYLTSLNLNQTQVDDRQLFDLGELPSLESLHLRQTPVKGPGLECLTELKELRELDLADSQIGDVGLKFITELPKLTCLVLSGTRITDAGLKAFVPNDTLRVLCLSRTELTGATLISLENFHSLNILELEQLPGLQFAADLERLKSLTRVSVRSTPISDAHLEVFDKLRELRLLSLSETRVTGTGLQHLTKLPHLRDLRLAKCELIRASARHLGQLVSLERLDLHDSSFCDSDLESLGSLTELQILNLTGTQLTDAALPLLLKFPRLKIVCVGETGLSDGAVERLESELAFCRVIRTRDQADAIPEEPWTNFILRDSLPTDDDVIPTGVIQVSANWIEIQWNDSEQDDECQVPSDALSPENVR